VAWACTTPLLMGMIPGLHYHLHWAVQGILASIATFGAGHLFFKRAWKQVIKGETSMDTLVALGSAVAWASRSTMALQGCAISPSRHPQPWWPFCSLEVSGSSRQA